MHTAGEFWEQSAPLGTPAASSPRKRKARGAILIVIIVTMIIVSIAGAGVLYLTSSATLSQTLVSNQSKAYYLAQSGIEYALPIIIDANDHGQTAPISALNSRTFTLADGNTFYLRTDNSNADYTIVESTGTVNPNSLMRTMQKMTYTVLKQRIAGSVYALQSAADLFPDNDSYVDSYNSGVAPWSARGLGQNAKLMTNSAADDKLHLKGKSVVYGDLVCGPGCNPVNNIKVDSGASYTGSKSAAASTVDMPAVTDPGGGTVITIGSATTLTAGTYRRAGSVDLNGTDTLTIDGSVTLIVTGDFNIHNTATLTINSGGSLTLIVMGKFHANDDAVVNGSGTPANCTIQADGDVTIEKRSLVYATIYTPLNNFVLKDDAAAFGAVSAKKVELHERSALHYDEALGGTVGGSFVKY